MQIEDITVPLWIREVTKEVNKIAIFHIKEKKIALQK